MVHLRTPSLNDEIFLVQYYAIQHITIFWIILLVMSLNIPGPLGNGQNDLDQVNLSFWPTIWKISFPA